MDPSYWRFRTFHQFLDAADEDRADYPATDACDDAIVHFGASCLRANMNGHTPLMRLASLGWDDLAAALVKQYPKSVNAVDWEGRPVWYYLVNNEPYAPDAKSIRFFQKFLKFPPLPNGDLPLHVIARNLVQFTTESFSLFGSTQNMNALSVFVSDDKDLLTPNTCGERPLDLLHQCLQLFGEDEQQVLQDLINADQNQRLSAVVQTAGTVTPSRKM